MAALAVTTIVPIGIHIVMQSHLGVPYPAELPRVGWATIPDHALRLTAAFALILILGRAEGRFWAEAAVFLLLSMGAINQVFLRTPIMQNMVSSKWTIYPFVDNLPAMLWYVAATILVASSARLLRSWWSFAAAAACIASFLDLLCMPFIRARFASIIAANERLEGEQLYNMPYDWHVNLPSYITFLEPSAAAWITAAALQRMGTSARATIVILFALQSGPIFRIFLNVHYASQGPLVAMLSEGQFALEAIALAALATIFTRRRISTIGRHGEV